MLSQAYHLPKTGHQLSSNEAVFSPNVAFRGKGTLGSSRINTGGGLGKKYKKCHQFVDEIGSPHRLPIDYNH